MKYIELNYRPPYANMKTRTLYPNEDIGKEEHQFFSIITSHANSTRRPSMPYEKPKKSIKETDYFYKSYKTYSFFIILGLFLNSYIPDLGRTANTILHLVAFVLPFSIFVHWLFTKFALIEEKTKWDTSFARKSDYKENRTHKILFDIGNKIAEFLGFQEKTIYLSKKDKELFYIVWSIPFRYDKVEYTRRFKEEKIYREEEFAKVEYKKIGDSYILRTYCDNKYMPTLQAFKTKASSQERMSFSTSLVFKEDREPLMCLALMEFLCYGHIRIFYYEQYRYNEYAPFTRPFIDFRGHKKFVLDHYQYVEAFSYYIKYLENVKREM